MLAAGATVPPSATGAFTYTYNLLVFDWDAGSDGMKVTIFPRAWSAENTEFEADDLRLGGHQPTIVLGCPNFRRGVNLGGGESTPIEAPSLTSVKDGSPLDRESTIDSQKSVTMPDSFPLILLRFFRDLSPTQRLAVLVELKALPDEWRDPLTHSVERQVVDSLAKRGRLAELDAAINKIMSQSGGTQGK
jgi:hypothetical protein